VPVSKYCKTIQIEAEKKGLNELQSQIDVDLKSIEDKNSPQHKAFCWSVLKDKKDKKMSIEIQRFVLAFIYFQFNGNSWKQCAQYDYRKNSPCTLSDNKIRDVESSRFLSSHNECGWDRTVCTEPGMEITKLNFNDLFSNNTVLEFNVTSEWKSLKRLKDIDFSSNGMVGSLPAMLGELPNLKRILLQKNKFRGKIPYALKNLTKTVELRLNSNRLTGTIPSWIATFRFLEILDLHGNMFSGSVPSELCNLQYLKKITVTCPNSTKNECKCCTCKTCTCK